MTSSQRVTMISSTVTQGQRPRSPAVFFRGSTEQWQVSPTRGDRLRVAGMGFRTLVEERGEAAPEPEKHQAPPMWAVRISVPDPRRPPLFRPVQPDISRPLFPASDDGFVGAARRGAQARDDSIPRIREPIWQLVRLLPAFGPLPLPARCHSGRSRKWIFGAPGKAPWIYSAPACRTSFP